MHHPSVNGELLDVKCKVWLYFDINPLHSLEYFTNPSLNWFFCPWQTKLSKFVWGVHISKFLFCNFCRIDGCNSWWILENVQLLQLFQLFPDICCLATLWRHFLRNTSNGVKKIRIIFTQVHWPVRKVLVVPNTLVTIEFVQVIPSKIGRRNNYLSSNLENRKERAVPWHTFCVWNELYERDFCGKKQKSCVQLKTEFMRLSTNWSTLRVHVVRKNLALLFFMVTTSILVSKWLHE